MTASVDAVDWKSFIAEYEAKRTIAEKARHLLRVRSDICCCPDWVSEDVWMHFLHLLQR